jgi:CBS-domain-containing membrane protein
MNHLLLSLLSGVGAAIAIGVLALLDSLQSDYLFLMAPFGATTVLLFGIPNSPLAQAKNVIFGHFITAFIGVLFVSFIEVNTVSLALATGLAVSVMLLTNTTHPPAGANPILIMLTGQGWSFLFSPVLLGAVLLVLVAKMFYVLQHKWVNQTEKNSP